MLLLLSAISDLLLLLLRRYAAAAFASASFLASLAAAYPASAPSAGSHGLLGVTCRRCESGGRFCVVVVAAV